MLIECPACHARAKIPEKQEGAKVRCGECGRVYVAAPPGARGRVHSSGSQTGMIIGVGVAVVALAGFMILSKGKGKAEAGSAEKTTEAPVVEDAPEIDDFGWESAPVQIAVQLHEAASLRDDEAIRRLLWGEGVYIQDKSGAPEPVEAFDEDVAGEFLLLSILDKDAQYQAWSDRLSTGADKELIADWKPYDGNVIELEDRSAIVRLDVQPRDSGDATKRTVEWRLVKHESRWKAWHWQRWISPEEQKANRKKRDKGYEKVTLSDGSEVLEREPEPLAHLADTPQDVRVEIDSLIATMLDLDLTREASQAQRKLEEIGKPAIPSLLTHLYENKLEDEDQAIRCNMAVQTLRRITGEYFGYKPQVLVGSGTGTTAERRESAIKQWFAWWYREGDKFTTKVLEDALEGQIELTDKEKKWLERNKD